MSGKILWKLLQEPTLNDLMCPYSSKPMVGAMVARCLRSNTIGSDLPQNQATKMESW